jgi:hypothetical protein
LTELEEVFRRQVDAFNDLDLEGFLACYHDDAVLQGTGSSELGSSEAVVGADAMRRVYAARLAEPGLHCEILETTTLGDRWLVARELVTTDVSRTHVLAVFEIHDGLIARTTGLRD